MNDKGQRAAIDRISRAEVTDGRRHRRPAWRQGFTLGRPPSSPLPPTFIPLRHVVRPFRLVMSLSQRATGRSFFKPQDEPMHFPPIGVGCSGGEAVSHMTLRRLSLVAIHASLTIPRQSP